MLLYKKNRKQIVTHNKKLDKYRGQQFKTVKEQKDFLTEKYPHKEYGKIFSWKSFFGLIYGFGKIMVLFGIFFSILNFFNIRISIYFALFMCILVPITSSYFLMKMNLENNDIIHLMRWKN